MGSGESERINVSELLRRAQEREHKTQSDLTVSPVIGPSSLLEDINLPFIEPLMDEPSSGSHDEHDTDTSNLMSCPLV